MLYKKKFLQIWNLSDIQKSDIQKSDIKEQPQKKPVQQMLFRIEDCNHTLLINSETADWYRALFDFKFENHIEFGKIYYDSLYDFNKKHGSKNSNNKETKNQAELRLLFSRPTMQEKLEYSEVMYLSKPEIANESTVNINEVRPGQTPDRIAGRKPKDFFPMLKAFIGVVYMGYRPEPKEVHKLLTTNLDFLKVCGFAPQYVKKYSFRHAPKLRKLEQFDQIMETYGIWDKMKIDEIKRNFELGYLKKENKLVGDTTHYHAYSAFKTIESTNKKGKKVRKSQSKTTKKCNCKDKEECNHEWELTDDGAGTIVKSSKRIYWGHKASIIGYPEQGIIIDAAPVADSATFDGKTIYPHLKEVLETYPHLKGEIDMMLYDSACDDDALKKLFKQDFDIKLKTSTNPRRQKDITENLPRGIKKITPFGNVQCISGKDLEYNGIRYDQEKFIFSAPKNEKGKSACTFCEKKEECCPNSEKGRIATISFDLMPFINPDDPPMAKRFKAIMKLRPSVERMIKTIKCDLTDPHLTKRGNSSFKAYLDKTMIAYHQMLRF